MACFLTKRTVSAIDGEAVAYMHEVMKNEIRTNLWRFCFVKFSLLVLIDIDSLYV
jgi:hypothetical protein